MARQVIETNFSTVGYKEVHIFSEGGLTLRIYALDGGVVIESLGEREAGLSNSLDWIALTMAEIRHKCTGCL